MDYLRAAPIERHDGIGLCFRTAMRRGATDLPREHAHAGNEGAACAAVIILRDGVYPGKQPFINF